MIIARKIKLTLVSEERDWGYKFIRDENLNQNKALNMAMSHLYFNYVAREKIKLADNTFIKKEKEYIELINKKVEELKNAKTDKQKKVIEKSLKTQKDNLEKHRKNQNKIASEEFKKVIQTNEANNLRDLITKSFDLTSDTKDRLTQKVRQDFSNDISEVLRGERVLRRYKKDNPLYIRGRALNFYKENDDYYIKWMKGIIFKCVLGIKIKNSKELINVLDNILELNYKVCDSSIQFDKRNNLMLNLSLDIPENKLNEKVKNRVVGVDLGLKIPAYVVLNDKEYIKMGIGSIDDFLKVRTQMQSRRRRLQKALKSTKGGKGREKKLKALERLTEKEKNFAKTYNHFISQSIIKFAVENKAEQINMELLSMKETQNKSVLRNWSYYQLQQFIEYKAKREGLVVKYVDSYHTSQICSFCGHYEEGQRVDQESFICKNEKCKNFNKKINADYNAARNIAKSTKYINDKKESEYFKKEIE